MSINGSIVPHDVQYKLFVFDGSVNYSDVYDSEIAEFQYKYFEQILSNEAALTLMKLENQ